MTKLSDTQPVILTAACQRERRLALPLPDRLKGGAAAKVAGSLLAKGLIEEAEAKPDDPVWREADGRSLTLVATAAALEALGIESDGDDATTEAAPAPSRTRKVRSVPKAAAEALAAGAKRKPREHSKQSRLIAMLRAPDGATVPEIAEALQWRVHTVRGAIAGALKKKLGLTVTSEKDETRGRVYRIADAG
jgi:hypothetical protein